ncbi:MAG: outer membrane protein assembly factor BamE [Burkholderiaceae bacterium]|nr:outer membrane protein assembly factor BamE [Burkholderiaceae bacterium]
MSKTKRVVGILACVAAFSGVVGCDWIAQRELRVGESTETEVRKMMGQPNQVWEEADGRRVLEFARGPAGQETYMVTIGADGRYTGMVNVLVDAYFDRVGAGMTRQALLRLLGKPTERVRLEAKNVDVWSWRHRSSDGRDEMFHVYFDAQGRVARTARGPDERSINVQ